MAWSPPFRGIENCIQNPADQAEMHHHRGKRGQRTIGIVMTDRHPYAVSNADGHPESRPAQKRPIEEGERRACHDRRTINGIAWRSFGMARCFSMFLARPLP